MQLHDLFRDPPPPFRQAAFWFWNHELSRDRLDMQIEQMHEKGLGGFVMHARHGLTTPYFSDAWFAAVRFCCEKARGLGMMAWAYDEKNWPSGPAAGEAIADPANRLNFLHLVEEAVEGPATVDFGPDVVSAYVGRPGESLRRVEGRSWDVAAGSWRIAKAEKFECQGILWYPSYLDVLSKRACRAFIKASYDRHEERLGDLRDTGLAGIFTDEAAFMTYPDDRSRVPWTAAFPEAFRRTKHYDLLDRLPEFFGQEGGGAQVRYDYWDVATSLFENAFFKPIARWCGKRGIPLTGHVLGEEPLLFQFRCVGNIFNHLKHLDMPGMDHLNLRIGKGSQQAMAPKLVASAALLAGRERTMTETFGESGWRLSLREMKWMADWQMANGINYIMPHAFYYSIAGHRKKDSPPSEFYQAPYWPYYKHFADYTARVTAMTTGGEHVAKIAVFYPMSSVWADYVPGDTAPRAVQEMEDTFAPLGEALLALHRDFVILDEESFAKAKARGGRFRVKGLEFEALVVPKLTSIRDDALAALRRVASQCPVVSLTAEPVRVLQTKAQSDAHRPAEVRLAEMPGVTAIETGSAEDLAAALASITPDVVLDGAPDVYYLHRRKESNEIFFFANTSDAPVSATASLEAVGRAAFWDAETGEQRDAPGAQVVEGRLEVPLDFAPVGSCLLVVDTARPAVETPRIEFAPGRRLKLCDTWAFTPENGNFLPLRDWDFTVRTFHYATELRYTTRFALSEYLANMRIILDGVHREPVGVPPMARSIVAKDTKAAVLLDGEPLTEELPWEFDPSFLVLSLGRLEPCTHSITIAVRSHGWFPQPGIEEYAWVAGDFAIDPDADPPHLVPVRGIRPGPWEEQGFPYFSGTGMYCTDFEVPPEVIGKRISLEAGNVGHLLEVEANGRVAGVRPWPPYRVDVSDLVCAGPNLFVLKVANTAANLFQGPDKDLPSGLLEDVYLEIEGR